MEAGPHCPHVLNHRSLLALSLARKWKPYYTEKDLAMREDIQKSAARLALEVVNRKIGLVFVADVGRCLLTWDDLRDPI